MGRILGLKSPFNEEILNHSEIQIDTILELYSMDHPDEFKFSRPGKEKIDESEIKASWTKVLLGNALNRYLEKAVSFQDSLRNVLKGIGTTTKAHFVKPKPKPQTGGLGPQK